MAREVLSNGVIVPEKYTRDWFDDFRTNLVKLNDAITAIAGKQNALTQEQLDAVNSAITSQKVTAYDDHIADTSKHLTDDTAPKAIADEDGTSIKTGYVNVAGNQTVSGQKTWSGNQFYTAGAYHRNNSYEIGNTPASNIVIPIYFADKNNVYTGYVRNVILATGKTQSELYARNKFTSGALSPTGTDVSSILQVEVQSNGDKTLYFDGSIRNNVLPYATNTYALGSSSYQWSSVYAQTYYYNGTAWGLDKYNTWTNSQAYKLTGTEVGSTTSGYISLSFIDKNNNTIGFQRASVYSDGRTCFSWKIYNTDNNSQSISSSLEYYITKTEVKVFTPVENGEVNLGTSNNKWKTLNGVNPGALSLPNASAKVQIDIPASWVWDGTTENSYVAPITGWLAIGSSQATYVRLFNLMSLIGSVVRSPTSSDMHTYIPMVAGDSILISGITSSSFLIRIYPCLGNV